MENKQNAPFLGNGGKKIVSAFPMISHAGMITMHYMWMNHHLSLFCPQGAISRDFFQFLILALSKKPSHSLKLRRVDRS